MKKCWINVAVFALSIISIMLIFPRTAFSQEQAMQLFMLPVGSYMPYVHYASRYRIKSSVNNQPARMGTLEQDLSFGLPVWQNETDEISFGGKVEADFIDSNAILPDTGNRFPERLWDIYFGPNYRHRFQNEWVFGISALAGSASDSPFSGYNVLDINSNIFLKIPTNTTDGWFLLLNYASNRQFLRHYPIPGFGYMLGSKKNVRGFFGIPFFVQFFPASPVSMRVSYIPVLSVDAVITGKPCEWAEPFIGYQWINNTYMREARPENDDRLYYQEMVAKAGVVFKPARWINLSLESGYSFQTKYFEGRHFYDDSFNKVQLSNAPYVSLDISVKFAPHSKREGEVRSD